MIERCDLAIVGAGAAGLMAAIQAARARPGLSIVLLDGARTLGAKILVAGGGRCNVTHHEVRPEDFAGGSRRAIGQVLRQLPVDRTIEFFRAAGVELKREATGKLFPVTDRARTVLDALLGAARGCGGRDSVSGEGHRRGGWGERLSVKGRRGIARGVPSRARDGRAGTAEVGFGWQWLRSGEVTWAMD